jgi:hypothetical protein
MSSFNDDDEADYDDDAFNKQVSDWEQMQTTYGPEFF